jgi:Protein of unknown function (DUF3618)
MARPSADQVGPLPGGRSPNGHRSTSGTAPSPSPSPPSLSPSSPSLSSPSPEALRAEIAQTRAALADTAGALAERFDVPTRVKARIRDSRALHDRPTLVAAAVAVVGAVVAVWAFRRQRRR